MFALMQHENPSKNPFIKVHPLNVFLTNSSNECDRCQVIFVPFLKSARIMAAILFSAILTWRFWKVNESASLEKMGAVNRRYSNSWLGLILQPKARSHDVVT